MKLITNNHERQFLYGYELPESAKADFDYLDQEDFDTMNFVLYRGYYYSIEDFMRISKDAPKKFHDFDGYHSDSFFSGVLIKVSPDGETYRIATYIEGEKSLWIRT